MPNRANIAAGYRWRMLFVSLFCLAFTLWFIYDGAIGYPAQAVRAREYQELEQSGREGWLDEWEKLAVERGWPTGDPGEPKGKADFIVQFMMAGIMVLFLIPFLYIYFNTRGSWIEIDDDGFSTSWGERCNFDDVTVFDKRKWYNKGIAVLRYEENGKKRRLVLDDCKYDRDVTEYFVREVELELDEEQIIGGRPRQPTDEGEGDDTGETSTAEPAQDGQ
jgi:hypothetical protein